jgi:OOP family OmpA-OmpF porin
MTAIYSRARKVMNWNSLKVFAIVCIAASALSQQDVKGSADPALFPNRMPGFFIYTYDQVEFASHNFATEPPQVVEGKYTKIDYIAKKDQPNPGDLAVRRNYENAVKAVGGEVLYSDNYHTVLKAVHGDTEVWTQIDTSPGDGRHVLHIIEKKPMVQVITADAMAASIDKTGFVALDIHFATGKAEILPESQTTVKEISAMLKTRPTLRVGVEGHTDNTGLALSNKTLSANRAKSVTAALVAAGVEAHRLRSAGYGQERPIADNRLEGGRAKNRRVEIVKD